MRFIENSRSHFICKFNTSYRTLLRIGTQISRMNADLKAIKASIRENLRNPCTVFTGKPKLSGG